MKKKSIKTVSLILAAMLSVCTFSSCGVLDECKKSQAVRNDDGSLSTSLGEKYLPISVPEGATVFNGGDWNRIYITKPDVPVLLSEFYWTGYSFISSDRTIIQDSSWNSYYHYDDIYFDTYYDDGLISDYETTFYVRGDLYEKYSADPGELSKLVTYTYVENPATETYDTKLVILGEEHSDALSEAVNGESVEPPDSYGRTYTIDSFSLNYTDENELFLRNTGYELCAMSDGSWYVVSDEGEWYPISDEYREAFDGLDIISRDYYGDYAEDVDYAYETTHKGLTEKI